MSVTCYICKEDFDLYTEEVSVLKCGHTYHKRCLQRWLDTNSACPELTPSTTNHFVEKLDPFKKENADLVYKRSSENTRNMLKVYEESIEKLRNVFTRRIIAFENEKLKLANDLKGCLKDLQKCLDEKDALKNEVSCLKLSIERLKIYENSANYLKAKRKKTLTQF